jgi:uncharacterized cupredoxin-like copper-binding protein
VLVASLSTDHKIGLGVVGALFIAFALASAFLFPRIRPNFPGRALPAFIVVCVLFFLGMLSAVETFGAEPKEGGEKSAESTTEQTTTQQTTTEQAQTTTTVALPPPTTTTTKSKPKPPPAPKQTIPVTETEFKITLPSSQLKAGAVTFTVKNVGQTPHDLVVVGNGVNSKTPLLDPGKIADLKVTLKAGKYELYCSVPGHKQAGMDTKVTVG